MSLSAPSRMSSGCSLSRARAQPSPCSAWQNRGRVAVQSKPVSEEAFACRLSFKHTVTGCEARPRGHGQCRCGSHRVGGLLG